VYVGFTIETRKEIELEEKKTHERKESEKQDKITKMKKKLGNKEVSKCNFSKTKEQLRLKPSPV
jgi:hypothetical protein